MKKLLAVFMVVSLVFCVAGMAAAAEPIKLKLGINDPDSSNYYKGAKAIADEVHKATNGRVEISVFPSGKLGNEREMVEAAMMGTLDMWSAASSVLANFIPQMKVLDIAFLWDNDRQANACVDGEMGKLIAAECEKKLNIKLLGWMESGFRDVFSTRPVKEVKDFNGLKIRTMQNEYHMAAFNSFGAIATPMAYNDVLPALQQGTIDAEENAISNCIASGYYEVTRHVTRSHHAFVYIPVGVSMSAWNKIPADLREPFAQAVAKGCKIQRKYLIEANNDATKKLKELGVNIYDIDRAQLQKLYAPQKAEAFKKMDPKYVALVEKAIKENK
ncbi:MAG: TRAP transporter substrate-binding protein [Synergistaceae bacterium]|nr:TRAP transporter substrate-binding protein [Synergistaceae bacterium]